MKKIAFILVTLFLLTGCGEAWKRTVKDLESNYNGGINRSITVFDYQGDTLANWTGKFDVQIDASGAGKVLFDYVNEHGARKRVVIQGGIVINEEF